MEIVLMRHGRPDIDGRKRSSPAQFREFMLNYDGAPLHRASLPSAEARSIASGCQVVVCSDLRRSIESAATLGHTDVHLRHEMFREILMPHAPLAYPRLSAVSWVMIFRALQLCGYSMGAESLASALRRAERCAARLIELAGEDARVLFVGHAAMNYLIARRLTRLGWLGTGARRQTHWGFIRFARRSVRSTADHSF